MTKNWTREKLQALIDSKEPESISLDYKSGKLLSENQEKIADSLSRFISSFANAGGGTLIIGIEEEEFIGPNGKYKRPKGFLAASKSSYSQDRLENTIDFNIRPRIQGVKIEAVVVGSDDEVVYVIEVPEGTIAHQAKDKLYYRRQGAKNLPMEDHEIRLVNNRQQAPILEIDFEIEEKVDVEEITENTPWEDDDGQFYPYKILGYNQVGTVTFLNVYIVNKGYLPANDVVYYIKIPKGLAGIHDRVVRETYTKQLKIHLKDIKGNSALRGNYEVAKAILPKTKEFANEICIIELQEFTEEVELEEVEWRISTDNASPYFGKIKVKDIKRKTTTRR